MRGFRTLGISTRTVIRKMFSTKPVTASERVYGASDPT
jgi:hypothetical protein